MACGQQYWAGQPRYFAPRPFIPTRNIPETFRDAVSYEGQIHYLANMCYDAYNLFSNISGMYFAIAQTSFGGSASKLSMGVLTPGDLSPAWTYSAEWVITLAEQLPDWVRPGDSIGVLVRAPQDETANHVEGGGVTGTEPKTEAAGWTTSATTTDTRYALVLGTVMDKGCGLTVTSGQDTTLMTSLNSYNVSLCVAYVIRDYQAWLNQIQTSINNIVDTLNDDEGLIADLKNRMHTAETDIDSLETRMTTAETNITNLDKRVTQNESDIDSLETRMTTAETNITNLDKRVTQNENDIDNLETNVTNLTSTVNNLDDSVWTAIKNVVSKVTGGGTVDETTGDITWGDSGAIAVGNISLYSQDSDPTTEQSAYIRTRTSAGENDYWVK